MRKKMRPIDLSDGLLQHVAQLMAAYPDLADGLVNPDEVDVADYICRHPDRFFDDADGGDDYLVVWPAPKVE